ncbi:hypothetical protein P7K49_034251 [Saguinus oedipus]|uniref:CATSPERG beta-propeller domain-containing protein n=1 Tax=Saguinus oedipus TaxID=9490 RepID=A0ABQ9TUS2_SAGOE|nr:hypothetical protein P7K49_034251 [Saguinus oedipus]
MLASLDSWVRVLASECIKKLCPVHFPANGSEYVMALTMGKNEGFIHLGTITVHSCNIIWSEYIADEHTLLLLVESGYDWSSKLYQLVNYNRVTDEMDVVYEVPEFVPEGRGKGRGGLKGSYRPGGAQVTPTSLLVSSLPLPRSARGLEFLMILGTETYTNTPMVPKGISFNPYNNLIFIWGNFLLQSSNKENFIYLADFPKEQTIKYIARSFLGSMAIVTETEEIWYLVEGTYQVYQLFPSRGWDVHVSLQLMQQSSLYSSNETMVTLFYEDNKLYQVPGGALGETLGHPRRADTSSPGFAFPLQLVYLTYEQVSRLVKRPVPVEKLLMYKQYTNHYDLEEKG